MITIYSSLRSFENEKWAIIQSNSLKSWLALNPSPQIIVFGDAPGVHDVCRQYDLTHIPNIRCSEGMAYMDSMLRITEEVAFFDTLLLLSPNIILYRGSKVLGAAVALSKKMGRFLAICKKSHFNDVQFIHISGDKSYKDFESKLISTQEWCDGFFMFNKGYFDYHPPFLFGGGGYNKWFHWYGGRYHKSLVWIKDGNVAQQQNFEIQELCESNQRLTRISSVVGPNYTYSFGTIDPPPTLRAVEKSQKSQMLL